jgi:outer membrane protein TolC
MTFIKFFLTFTTLLYSTALLAEKADPPVTLENLWGQALANGPDLRIAISEIRRARAAAIGAGRLLPSNPEFEGSITNGDRKQAQIVDPAAGIQPHIASQSVSGYEAGISQEIEIAGQRGVRKRIAELSLESARIGYSKRLFEIRSHLREHYYRLSLSRDMEEHLQEHIEVLGTVKKRFGPNYRDPRLGGYVLTAISVDSARMRSEKSDWTTAKIEAESALRVMTRFNGADLRVTDAHELPLPSPPACREIVSQFTDENPESRSLELGAKIAELERSLANRNTAPNATLFAFAGKRTVGGDIFPTPIGPPNEEESYLRAGIRIPIPLFNTNRSDREKAKAIQDASEAKRDAIVPTHKMRLSNLCDRYATLSGIALEIRKTDQDSHTYLDQMMNALLNRRISYFEFLTEIEKWHDLKNRYYETVIEAIRTLGEMETLAGLPLDSLRMPAETTPE